MIAVLSFVPPVWRLMYASSISVYRGPVAQQKRVLVGPGISSDTWLKADRLSKHVMYAIVVAEDARFFEHWGLDFKEIFESFKVNYRAKKIVRGGSTITQQLVKMAFLTRERTYTRKIQEALGALWIESMMSKARIMEWYVNLAEFGPGIYGIHEASRQYFHTPPERLSLNEGIHLALVLPSPNRYSKGLRVKKLTEFGKFRFHKILTELLANGYITALQFVQAKSTGDFGGPLFII
jgi:monofunctional biosynthetic peptidoglycan transglycosylase